MAEMDARGILPRYFEPPLTDIELAKGWREGWILGVIQAGIEMPSAATTCAKASSSKARALPVTSFR